MPHVSVKQSAPVEPPLSVTITLDEDEATDLLALLGQFGSEYEMSRLFDAMYEGMRISQYPGFGISRSALTNKYNKAIERAQAAITRRAALNSQY